MDENEKYTKCSDVGSTSIHTRKSPVKLIVELEVEMDRYDDSKSGNFDFFADTDDVGQVVLTPYDSNIHFTHVSVISSK